MESYLIISDYHAPYGHPRALEFCKGIQLDFGIQEEHVYCVGDFEDQYNFGRWPKSPDRPHTPIQELQEARHQVSLWGEAFPIMKMCTSNHGTRIAKKAFDAEIPAQLMVQLAHAYGYPPGWKLAEEFVVVGSRHEFVVQHGEGFSGVKGHIDAAVANGISTVIGHLHAFAGVSHIRTKHQSIWAANSGCLLDPGSFAFEYGKHLKFKPTVGCIVVTDGGRWPIFIPMDWV